MNMEYRLPTLSDREELAEYVKEHYDHGEQGISASMGLPSMEYADWVQMIADKASSGDSEWGRSLVYLCIDDGQIKGLLSIRYELPAELTAKYGDIGYGVRPTERGKGYATEMLRHALEVCREHGMKKVVLGCYKDNIASGAVIRKCGGILTVENDNYEQGRVSQYYDIVL